VVPTGQAHGRCVVGLVRLVGELVDGRQRFGQVLGRVVAPVGLAVTAKQVRDLALDGVGVGPEGPQQRAPLSGEVVVGGCGHRRSRLA
jgi:hypothetical protein